MTESKIGHKPKKIHLVCNAHLDPVWLWQWEEGVSEALSTFRVAADFCDRFPEFVFNHNEAVLYRWVEEYEPKLFSRIQAHVAAARWHIAGGAFLQPDVNGPSGESHIRQFLAGLTYFQQKFNVRPRTAYNFDPFGHAEGYPQVLRACGMDSYIFCRPAMKDFELPVGTFLWQDRSGACVHARRGDEHYHTYFNLHEKLEKFVEHYRDEPETMFLWGLGNHGGGPYLREYEQIKEWFSTRREFEFVHSTPEAFFDAVRGRGGDFPTVHGEIQNAFPGCYTSMSRVKRAHRQAESLMAMTERLAALNWWHDGVPYPKEALDAAWRDILFAEFHDILPGTCTLSVEADSLALLDRCIENLRRLQFRAFMSALRGQVPTKGGEIPLFFINPHAVPVSTTAEVEFHLGGDVPRDRKVTLEVRDAEGNLHVSQRIKPEHNLGAEFRVRLAVPVRLGPFQLLRLDAYPLFNDVAPASRPQVSRETLDIRTRTLRITINPDTGLVNSITRNGEGCSYVAESSFAPVLFNDLDHSWTCGDPALPNDGASWEQPMAPAWKTFHNRFELATSAQVKRLSPPGKRETEGNEDEQNLGDPNSPIRIVEDGPCRIVVEATFVQDESVVVREYVIDRHTDALDIRDRIYMNHKDAMLKLAIPLGFRGERSYSETLYSVAERVPTEDFADRPNQRWVAVTGAGLTIAALNTGSFAHSFTQNELLLNVLRTPPYASFGLPERDHWVSHRFAQRMDQGYHEVQYRFLFDGDFDEASVSREAQLLNMPPVAHVHFPQPSAAGTSTLATAAPILSVANDAVQITAVKCAEQGDGLIVRLLNTSAASQVFSLQMGTHTMDEQAIDAYQLVTVKIMRRDEELLVEQVSAVEEPWPQCELK